MKHDNTYTDSMYQVQAGHFGDSFNLGVEDEELTNPNRPDSYQIQALKNQKIQIVLSVALLFLLVYLNFFKEGEDASKG